MRSGLVKKALLVGTFALLVGWLFVIHRDMKAMEESMRQLSRQSSDTGAAVETGRLETSRDRAARVVPELLKELRRDRRDAGEGDAEEAAGSEGPADRSEIPEHVREEQNLRWIAGKEEVFYGQPIDASWARRTETDIEAAFASALRQLEEPYGPVDARLLGLECRTTWCAADLSFATQRDERVARTVLSQTRASLYDEYGDGFTFAGYGWNDEVRSPPPGASSGIGQRIFIRFRREGVSP